MEIVPVKKYQVPDYPTQRILEEHSELLHVVPERWRGNAAVLTALVGLGMIASGCQRGSSSAVHPRIAPVFQHGDGRGWFGCQSINPPVFLSEAEARQVINEEAKRAGIIFAEDSQTTPAIQLPATYARVISEEQRKRLESSEMTFRAKLVLDGTDAKRKIAYEYVSIKDYSVWDKTPKGIPAIVGADYYIKEAAKGLRDALRKAPMEGTYAVFYDPIATAPEIKDSKGNINWDATIAKREIRGKEIAREQLRAQVRDFIKWLKAEGVI